MAGDAGMLATDSLREVEQNIAEKVREAHHTSKAEQVDSEEEAAGKEQRTQMRSKWMMDTHTIPGGAGPANVTEADARDTPEGKAQRDKKTGSMDKRP